MVWRRLSFWGGLLLGWDICWMEGTTFKDFFVSKNAYLQRIFSLSPPRSRSLQEDFRWKKVSHQSCFSFKVYFPQWICSLPYFPFKEYVRLWPKNAKQAERDASQKLRGGDIKWTLRKSIKKHTVVYLWLPTPRRVTSYFLTSQVSAPKK